MPISGGVDVPDESRSSPIPVPVPGMMPRVDLSAASVLISEMPHAVVEHSGVPWRCRWG